MVGEQMTLILGPELSALLEVRARTLSLTPEQVGRRLLRWAFSKTLNDPGPTADEIEAANSELQVLYQKQRERQRGKQQR